MTFEKVRRQGQERSCTRKPIGTLVTLDKVYELVEGNLSNEKRTDIHQIFERFKNHTDDHGWGLRVANVSNRAKLTH